MIRAVFDNFGILFRRFVWSSHMVTRAPPHIRDANNVQRLWNYFVIASIPGWLIGLWSLGHQTNLAIADFALDPAPGLRAALLLKTGIGLDAFDVMACVAPARSGSRCSPRCGASVSTRGCCTSPGSSR
jgi:hypothetical protein